MVLYFTMFAWLVGREGELYRHELKQRRVVSAQASDTTATMPTLAAITPNAVPTEAVQPGGHSNLSACWRSTINRPIVPEPPTAVVAPAGKPDPRIEHPVVARARPVVDPRPPNLRGLAPESLRGIGEELYKAITAGDAEFEDPRALNRLQDLAGRRSWSLGQTVGRIAAPSMC